MGRVKIFLLAIKTGTTAKSVLKSVRGASRKRLNGPSTEIEGFSRDGKQLAKRQKRQRIKQIFFYYEFTPKLKLEAYRWRKRLGQVK